MLAFMVFLEWAGIIITWPVFSNLEVPSIVISALPSIAWTKVSNGETFPVSVAPASKATALTFPVVFLITVLVTTDLGTYSRTSIMINTFDFSISGSSNG